MKEITIKVNTDNYSDELIDLEGDTAFTEYELEEVYKEDVEGENEGLDLSHFCSLEFKKHINKRLPLFEEYDEDEFDIECRIIFYPASPIFDETGDEDVKISSLGKEQKDKIREYLETINKISYKGTKLVNLDIDYVLNYGEIEVLEYDESEEDI